ncbi:MAG: CBS domain-containing protein [Syntrophobacterales bacterium]|nr:MAG: CBS domain-containing protein [Syntrophobacterales bacterium]
MEVITTHINADFDALACMLAAKKLYPEAILVFPGAQEGSLRDFFVRSTIYVFEAERMKNVDLDRITRLVLVDTRQISRIGKFAQIVNKRGVDIHIYDHHPASSEDIEGSVEVVREVGAAITLLLGILRDKGIEITSDEATVMMLGIYEDTGSLTFSSTTEDDFHAAAYLLSKKASLNVISDMVTKELTAEQVFLLNDLIQSATNYAIGGINVVIATASADRYVGDIAILVHKLKDMENLDVLIALIRMEDRVHIIGRSRIEEVNVAEILLEFGGGGHATAASATVKDMTLIQCGEKLVEVLQETVKPRKFSKDLMTFPVKTIPAERKLSEAGELLTRYNINVLPVMRRGKLVGLISRQVIEKATFHGLGNRPVKEYMSTEYSVAEITTPLSKIQRLIVGNNQRFLPVMEGGKLVGAITRTDVLRAIQEDFVTRSDTPSPLEVHKLHARKKIITKLMEERLPPKVQSILREFGRVGDELNCPVYAVGGFVRDLLLRNHNLDVDIVVEGDGIRFAEYFAKGHPCKIRMNRRFGTAALRLAENMKVDIATARLEYYDSPAALPTVELSSIKRDMYRRDFTINTLAIKLNGEQFGELVDFFGAQRDIKEKVIRVLHNLSFVEDPTRVLRAIRFEQRFGFQLGKQTQNLIKNAVERGFLDRLSGRRIYTELVLILNEEDPIPILRRMRDLDLLKSIHIKIPWENETENLLETVKNVISWYDLLFLEGECERWQVYFYGLMDSLTEEEVSDVCQRLSLSNKHKEKIISGRREAEEILREMARRLDSKRRIRRSEIYELLEPLSTEVRLFMMAKTTKKEMKQRISLFFTTLRGQKPLLKGRDLIRLGVRPGPIMKEILIGLLRARLDRRIKTREEEVDYVKRTYIDHGGTV